MFERDPAARDAAGWFRAALDSAPFPVGICAEGQLVYENARFSRWIHEPEQDAPHALGSSQESTPERPFLTRSEQVRVLVADLRHVLPGSGTVRLAGPTSEGMPTTQSPAPSRAFDSSRCAAADSPKRASGADAATATSAPRQSWLINGAGQSDRVEAIPLLVCSVQGHALFVTEGPPPAAPTAQPAEESGRRPAARTDRVRAEPPQFAAMPPGDSPFYSELGRITAGLAHEINNPLALTLGSLELAEQKLQVVEDAAFAGDGGNSILQLISNAREGAERVRRIMRDLMALARPIAESKRLVDLEAVLDSMVSLAWNEIRHRARLVKRYARVPAVLGDESRLGQVFLNLLVNTAEGLREARSQDASITLCTSTDGERVVVEVSDTSPALTHSGRASKEDGNPTGRNPGLGLAICQAIVASHGGQMDVGSPERAAHFRVSLPVPAPVPQSPPSSRPVPKAAGARILIVDDEPLLGQTLAFAFSGRHDIEIASSGRDALAKLGKDSSFDMVLCDLMMPDVAGIQVYEEVARHSPELLPRFVFMTGGAFTEPAQDFMDRYSGRMLEKPFTIREIEELLSEIRSRSS